MQFVQVDIHCDPNFIEILIAELSDSYGYDSFWENEQGFIAYIEKSAFREAALNLLQSKYPDAAIHYAFESMESKNWNEEWEKNFQPIKIAGKCYVRAPFHASHPEIPLEVVIEPKMSFGTGHHATTYSMIELMLDLPFEGARVLDVGCGTGILAIVASKLGASYTLAFDIEDWAVANSLENVHYNQASQIDIRQGTIAEVMPVGHFEIVMSNITRNVLLEEIPVYSTHQSSGGSLLLSGFYEEDAPMVTDKAASVGYKLLQSKVRDKWCALHFERQ